MAKVNKGATPGKVIIGLGFLGLVPALVFLMFLRLEEGHLVVGGQALAEYSLARLIAGLLSIMTPIYLLVPLAFSGGPGPRTLLFWGAAFAAPFVLLGPSLLAGWIIGGTDLLFPLFGLAWLGVMTLCFVLWTECLQRVVDFRLTVLIYGGVWASSGFVAYLTDYVVPYMDIRGLGLVTYLNWVLPQLQSGLALLDDYLQTETFPIGATAPTLIQLPILAVLLWFIHRRDSARSGTA